VTKRHKITCAGEARSTVAPPLLSQCGEHCWMAVSAQMSRYTVRRAGGPRALCRKTREDHPVNSRSHPLFGPHDLKNYGVNGAYQWTARLDAYVYQFYPAAIDKVSELLREPA